MKTLTQKQYLIDSKQLAKKARLMLFIHVNYQITNAEMLIDFLDKKNALLKVLTKLPAIIQVYFPHSVLKLSHQTDLVTQKANLLLEIVSDLPYKEVLASEFALHQNQNFYDLISPKLISNYLIINAINKI